MNVSLPFKKWNIKKTINGIINNYLEILNKGVIKQKRKFATPLISYIL